MSLRIRARRGIILLVVMSLIALFSVITIGFVLVASLQLKTAQQASRAEQRSEDPVGLLDEVADQILRGSKNDTTPLQGVSLLEDMYGYDVSMMAFGGVLRGGVTAAAFAPNGGTSTQTRQFVDLELSLPTSFYNPALPPPTGPLGTASGLLNGRILTFLTGPRKLASVRVVDYQAIVSGGGSFRPRPLVRIYSPDIPNPGDLVGAEVIINDRPFDGSGNGLGITDPSTFPLLIQSSKNIDFKLSDNGDWGAGAPAWPQALLINRSRAARTIDEAQSGDRYYPDPSGVGGADEDYDAADYQNLLLALRISTRTGTAVPLPSLHRPDLIKYWIAKRTAAVGTGWPTGWPAAGVLPQTFTLTRADRDLLRKICLRPLPFDHPRFAAVNPALATLEGLSHVSATTQTMYAADSSLPAPSVWDVDNDGDGTTDSIWVDLGYPVRTDSKGRRYKPLFAILCVDLDGKLNLNAHGAPEALARATERYNFVGPFAAQQGFASLPVGQGYGPADIRLNEVFHANPIELWQLFHGRYDTAASPPVYLDGRYGEKFLLKDGKRPMPGRTTDWANVSKQAGQSGFDDDQDGNTDTETEYVVVTNDQTVAAANVYDDNFPPAPMCWLPITGSLSEWRGDALAGGQMYFSGPGAYSTLRSGRRLPLDVNGNGAMGVDLRGLPFMASIGEGNETIDDPYEIDLSDTRSTRLMRSISVATRGAAADMPFRPSELEALLRRYDPDSSALENRLPTLAPLSLSVRVASDSAARIAEANYLSSIFTTETWDLPVANLMMALPEILGVLPAGAPGGLGGTNPLTDFIEGSPLLPPGLNATPLSFRYTNMPKITLLLQSLGGTGGPPTDFDRELRELLYPGYFDSMRFDLGRTLGNAWDDNGNFVIDEPGETTTWPPITPIALPVPPGFDFGNPQPLWQGSDAALGTIAADLNNDGLPDNLDNNKNGTGDGRLDDNDLLVRHSMARHLYFLAVSMRNVVMSNPDVGGQTLDDKIPGIDIVDNRVDQQELAQWAVNVVDYMDADSISTGFEYDKEPGDGWDVDGDLSTIEMDPADLTKPHPDRGVVWGVERQELLITEAFAMHDLRTGDTNTAGPGDKLRYSGDPADRDDDLDQVRRPEGSLFFELYNPQGIGQPAPAEFYWRRNPLTSAVELNAGVNLRAKDAATDTDPVWRVVVWRNRVAGSPQARDERLAELRRDPTFPAGDLPGDDPNIENQLEQDHEIERSIYFANPGTGERHDGLQYYPKNASEQAQAILRPGLYSVVGPGDAAGHTVVGAEDASSPGSQPRLTFLPGDATTDPATFLVINDQMMTPYPRYSGDDQGPVGAGDESIQPPLGVLIDDGENGGRMSISEPTTAARQYPARPVNGDGTYTEPADEPFDAEDPQEDWVTHAQAEDGDAGPVSDDEGPDQSDNRDHNVATPDELLNYRYLVLQRLANPLLPFDRETNPYISVDWMPVDLTLFNSTFGDSDDQPNLKTRQRSGVGLNLFAEEEYNDDQRLAGGTVKLQHTLGYLNEAFHASDGTDPANPRWLSQSFLDTLDAQVFSQQAAGYDKAYYIGSPRLPFPYIWHANRPLLSQYELMVVPKSSPSLLLREFSRRKPLSTPGKAYFDKEGNYSHLLNFFGANPAGVPLQNAQNDLYRIFDMLQVKSPFSGTEVLLNPADFANFPQASPLATPPLSSPIFGWFKLAGGTPPSIPDLYARSFRPPFNRLSTFREPGRINLNSIFDEGETLKALAGGLYDRGTRGGFDLWSRFIASRRGYLPPASVSGSVSALAMGQANENFPSLLSNPFRTFSGGHLAPVPELQRSGVNCTLLRPDPLTVPPNVKNDPESGIVSAFAAENGLFELTGAVVGGDAPLDNPYFAYQLYNRLGNLTTTRSNVYAVWITVGLFEVEPVPTDSSGDPLALTPYSDMGDWTVDELSQVYPDGYRLMNELGADSGDIKRHRAFYIIDRTIPVAFERGETHNSREAIILRRIIE